ncbi:hypothetical protein D3C87_279010 [compost metagenome]
MKAKMSLETVQRFETSEILRFKAVAGKWPYPQDGSDEDNTYARFTPTAEFQITVTNPDLFGKFNPGEKYYVDFTKAE